MNVLNRMMSYDKTKNENQEKCNCAECIGNAEISEKTEIVGNFEYADDFLIKVKNYQMMCREYEILNTMNLEYWYKDVKTKWFIFRALWVHGNKYDYHKTKYIKYKEKVEIICRVKGHKSFPQKPSDHLNGKGCSLCCEKSKGEIKIRLFLTSNDIQFEREKRFKDCRDKYPLPFDFYIPRYNLCIEFDGIQHFSPSSFVYGNTSEKEKLENFEYIQRHDRIKNEYCKKNGITLLRFNNLKTVEQELAEYFQNHGTITELSLFDL